MFFFKLSRLARCACPSGQGDGGQQAKQAMGSIEESAFFSRLRRGEGERAPSLQRGKRLANTVPKRGDMGEIGGREMSEESRL